jgi:hypothetical protein
MGRTAASAMTPSAASGSAGWVLWPITVAAEATSAASAMRPRGASVDALTLVTLNAPRVIWTVSRHL